MFYLHLFCLSANNTLSFQVPTVELIRELGKHNVYWTAQQLDAMSLATFQETVDILGDVPNYGTDKLAVLSKKAIEVLCGWA